VRAIVMASHGGPEVLVCEDRRDPEPGLGEVLVRVGSVAVNRLDLQVREGGGHGDVAPSRLPLVPGYDAAGEVVALGPGVSGVQLAQRVYVHYDYSCGRCEFCLDGDESLCAEYAIMGADHDGGYAELVVAPARNLFALDDGVSFDAAAAVGSVYLTAYHMLFARAALRPGETVLIMAAGSGVGGAAMALAKWAGARVIATASTAAKRQRAIVGGADHAIDYTVAGWDGEVRRLTGGRGVDCVIDHTGSAQFSTLMTRPQDVLIDPEAPLRGIVRRLTPLEDGIEAELEVPGGVLPLRASLPDPRLGDEIGIRLTSSTRYPIGLVSHASTAPVGLRPRQLVASGPAPLVQRPLCAPRRQS